MEDNKFRFSYSAPTKTERQEIEDIRKSYLNTGDKNIKLDEIRDLDNKVKNTPKGISIVVCVVGVLVFGLGLTCILEWKLFVLGVIISIVGSTLIGLTHFVYIKLKLNFTNKYRDRILTLSEELLNDSNLKGNIKKQEAIQINEDETITKSEEDNNSKKTITKKKP